jgi:hypothetical protein
MLREFTDPFPHTIIEDAIPIEDVRAINDEWPTEGITKEDGRHQKKWSISTVPKTARKVMDGFPTSLVEQVTGLYGLFLDPWLEGAGLHSLPCGGFLNMHTDFNVHPHHQWHRRANVLIYLNEDWDEAWGGHLILGKNREKKISPRAGRAVIFETNQDSWHGNPEPVTCPEGVERRSLAMYYYTPAAPKEKQPKTKYIK